jgi:ABC-2 type transport system ATP-binding protein
MSSPEIIASLNGVTKSYGSVTALRDVSLDIHRGEMLALLGPNGAGKTSAVRLLLGLSRPTAGSVRVFGGDPLEAPTRARVGVMLQVAKVPDTLRVREHVHLFSSYYPAPMPLDEVLQIARLEHLSERNFSDLSGGEKQRVLFALSICGNPDLLVLDEPTVGLDVETRRALWGEIERLRARGKSVLLTTHYLDEADALATRVAVIDRGRIIADGTPSEIKQRSAGRKVRFVTPADDETLRRTTGVSALRRDGHAVEIVTNEPEAIVRSLMLAGVAMSELEVSSAGLEEAFLSLTTGTDSQKEVA